MEGWKREGGRRIGSRMAEVGEALRQTPRSQLIGGGGGSEDSRAAAGRGRSKGQKGPTGRADARSDGDGGARGAGGAAPPLPLQLLHCSRAPGPAVPASPWTPQRGGARPRRPGPVSSRTHQLGALSAAPASRIPAATTGAPAPCSPAPSPAAAEAAAAAAAPAAGGRADPPSRVPSSASSTSSCRRAAALPRGGGRGGEGGRGGNQGEGGPASLTPSLPPSLPHSQWRQRLHLLPATAAPARAPPRYCACAARGPLQGDNGPWARAAKGRPARQWGEVRARAHPRVSLPPPLPEVRNRRGRCSARAPPKMQLLRRPPS